MIIATSYSREIIGCPFKMLVISGDGEWKNTCVRVQPSTVIMNTMTWLFATAVEPTEIGSFVILERNVGTPP